MDGFQRCKLDCPLQFTMESKKGESNTPESGNEDSAEPNSNKVTSTPPSTVTKDNAPKSGDEIDKSVSLDESLPPDGYDDSVLHLEQDLQKLVDILERHENNYDLNKKRYHAEQQQKLSNIKQGKQNITTGIVNYEEKAKELKKLINETQNLIDKRSTCTSDSRTNPQLFFPPGSTFLKHTDIVPTQAEIDMSNQYRKSAKTERNRRSRQNRKRNKEKNKEFREKHELTHQKKVKVTRKDKYMLVQSNMIIVNQTPRVT